MKKEETTKKALDIHLAVMKREAHIKRMDASLRRAYERYKEQGGIKNMHKFGLVHLVHNKSIAQIIYEEMER